MSSALNSMTPFAKLDGSKEWASQPLTQELLRRVRLRADEVKAKIDSPCRECHREEPEKTEMRKAVISALLAVVYTIEPPDFAEAVDLPNPLPRKPEAAPDQEAVAT